MYVFILFFFVFLYYRVRIWTIKMLKDCEAHIEYAAYKLQYDELLVGIYFDLSIDVYLVGFKPFHVDLHQNSTGIFNEYNHTEAETNLILDPF